MDIPLFGDAPNKRRREINLGGAHTATSHNDILQEAKLRRSQRNDLKRRQDSALLIQHWWRGRIALNDVRGDLRHTFDQDVTSITGLRCLVLLGQDEDALGRWSTVVLSSCKDVLSQGDQSWVVLLQRLALILLRSISTDPRSQYARAHLDVLATLLSSNPQRLAIAQYLVSHGFYTYLRHAVLQLPMPAKASPILTSLATLLTAPLAHRDILAPSLREFVTTILTVPLLPNRLLPAIGPFSARLPLASLNLVPLDILDSPALVASEPKIHLLANLALLMPPRYTVLPPAAFATYLQLAALLMNALPTNALEPAASKPGAASNWADDDSDDETETTVTVVSSFESRDALPQLDEKTRKRLLTLPSSEHIASLLRAGQSQALLPHVISFCFALSTVWPTRRDKVLTTFMAYNKGGLVREIYRGFVRRSPLGRDDSFADITKLDHAADWPPLLLLADLYTQALLTMGDDEFFSSGKNPAAPRNPLSLDELTEFSRKLLNIAFSLYWRDDSTSVQDGSVPGLGSVKWENVREKATKCLQALHARDSRRTFTPKDHWLVTSQLDMTSFIQAAIFEEQELSQPENGRATSMSKRQIAYLSPRLGVLNNIPFAIPFDVRVGIFRRFVINDMQSRGLDSFRGRMSTTRVTVRRTNIAQDGFDRLGDVDLKTPIAITFMDQFGNEEAGIDGGGVFKEFLTSLCKEVFDSDRGLWLANKKNELYPAPHSYATEAHSLAWYRFIGRILGKALYDGILIDVAFAGFFLAKWLGKQSWLDDLASLDPELYSGLIFLKHYEGDPEELSLNFTVSQEEFGVMKTADLIPNGSNIPVTRENRLQYIYLVAHHRLTKQIKKQSTAFFEGLSEIIDPKWLRMFNQQELQILLGGVNAPIDLDDLRSHTQYGGLYDDHEHTIEIFWSVVKTFNQDERRKLLRFVTSCSRPPLLGFKELNPNFAIRDATGDETRLPTASTCVNLLKLPRYKSPQVLREKLVQAINSNAGFDLS
ncbi:HECT-domain-containing protein [Trametes versicolor FP-101664 SS1]|uniref:HECT-type E3 ubiquitin transferase n=1 Tax=Trametes versicolor (strain FP-101664) TaxID=717944 RepID=R7S6P8_TRAVS|nr:HECT-domain-containing protein [Trametes versicolor FP-101664 SS1]EIW51561.1 HECT-domain-containing protein [Trametes versicolor FP-101664 SS1]